MAGGHILTLRQQFTVWEKDIFNLPVIHRLQLYFNLGITC